MKDFLTAIRATALVGNMPDIMRIPKNSVALAGEFAALSQLAVNGYVASMTLGNTKNIDILVFDPKTNKANEVEVKTNFDQVKTNRDARKHFTESKLFGRCVTSWQMHKKHEEVNDPHLFYCFVNINHSPTDRPVNLFRFFIVPSAIVAKYVRQEHQAWLDENPKHRTSDRRLFRIAYDNETPRHAPQAPFKDHYEDKWTLLGAQ